MKIKNNVSVTLVESGYKFIITPPLDENGQVPKWAKPKKIMSRNVPELLGLNRYNSIGKAVLDRMCALQKEFIDPFYTVRGAVGEYVARLELERRYGEKEINTTMQGFTTEGEGFDMFKVNPKFGGVIDILATEPSNAVIEVKSKDNSKWVEIADIGKYPEEEVMQGKTLAYLIQAPTATMAYVFTSNDCEKKLKEYVEKKRHLIWQKDESGELLRNEETGKALPPLTKSGEQVIKELGLTLRDFTYKFKSFPINREEVREQLEQAYQTYMELSNHQQNKFTIPVDKFTKYEIQDLEKFRKGDQQ